MVDLMADIRNAENDLAEKKRRLAKEKAKAENAAREAEAIGAKEPESHAGSGGRLTCTFHENFSAGA